MIRNLAAQRGGFYCLACANSNLSGLDADYVRSDFAVHGSAPEPLRDSFSSDVGCLAKPRRITCFDLVSERCSLAIRDGRDLIRLRPTAGCQCGDHGCGCEPCFRKIPPNDLMVVIAVGCAREKSRRVVGKDCCQRACHGVSEFVLFDAIPYVEKKDAACFKHSTRFRIGSRFFREEHYAELAHNSVKCPILEGEL